MIKTEQDTKEQIEILRRLKPKDKLRIAFELHEFVRIRITTILKQQYPELSEKQLKDKVQERFML